MAYIRIKGIPGLVYQPDTEPTQRKHDCKDCYACQWCAETRCQSCRQHKRKRSRDLK
ncbi:hypothetical protein ACFL6U_09975 [Planctomycetota bacterium]